MVASAESPRGVVFFLLLLLGTTAAKTQGKAESDLLRLMQDVLRSEADYNRSSLNERQNSDDYPGCGAEPLELSDAEGVLFSPNYGSYPNNLDCVYEIHSQPLEEVILTFEKVAIQYSNWCGKDSLEIWHDVDGNDELMNKLCGRVTIPPISTFSTHVQLRFHTNAYKRKRGFKIKWEVKRQVFPGCGAETEKYLSGPGTVRSPGYENGAYPGNAECGYMIESPEGQTITLDFRAFDVEGGDGCPYDYLEVYEGSGQVVLLKVCGSELPDSITSTTDSLFIQFSSDFSVEKAGWAIDYTFNDGDIGDAGNPCDGTPAILETDAVGITSPNFGLGEYPDNADCLWHIKTVTGEQIRIQFEEFALEMNDVCDWDYVKITAGHKDSSADYDVTLCDLTPPPDLIIPGTEATVYFHTDQSIHLSGFKIVVTSETAQDGGDNGDTDDTGDDGDTDDTGDDGDTDDTGDDGDTDDTGDDGDTDDTGDDGDTDDTSDDGDTDDTGDNGDTDDTGDDGDTDSPDGPLVTEGCDFENGWCGWTNDVTEDQVDWVLRQASEDHDYKQRLPGVDVSEGTAAGHYIMSETQSATKGDVARLVSAPMPPTQGSGRCLRFAYTMNGYRQGTVNLKIINQDGEEDVVWSRHGNHGLKWFEAMATLRSSQSHHLLLEVTVNRNIDSFVLLDDFQFTEEACVVEAPDCGQRGSAQEKKILNGQQSSEGEWPWIAHLEITDAGGGKYQCGASLIHPQWLLSAAHCFEYSGEIAKGVYVYFGETSLINNEDSNFRLLAEDVIINPGRTSVGVAPNDIALVKLPYAVHLTDTTNTVCLPESGLFMPGDVCTTVGWGVDGNNQVTTDLFHFDSHLISDYECSSYWSGITNDMLCTADTVVPSVLQSSCPGDSGGPLACEKDGMYYLAGVVSWGQFCNSDDQNQLRRPGVFAEVSEFLPWIQTTMATYSDTPIN